MIKLSNKDADYIANFVRNMINERKQALDNLDEIMNNCDEDETELKDYVQNAKDKIINDPQTIYYNEILYKTLELMMCGSDNLEEDIEENI